MKNTSIVYDGIIWTLEKSGYMCANLNVNGKFIFTRLHRYVWEKYNGPIPDDKEIHHKDENKLNNNIDNLELLTESKHLSLHTSGEKHHFYGRHHSQETIKKISETKKRRYANGEVIHPSLGYCPSAETRLKMRMKKLGKKHTPEHILAIKNTQLERFKKLKEKSCDIQNVNVT